MPRTRSSFHVPTNQEAEENKNQMPILEDELVEENEQMPEWLQVLLKTRFWEQCQRHTHSNRAEESLFCLYCYEVVCPHCIHDEPGHRLLKVRRYVYRSVVLVKDMQDLNIDVSRVQPYIINSQKVVHLRPMKRSPLFRPQVGAPKCLTCSCWIRNAPSLFCSLTCQGKVNVSQDDFSGPEAERRYKSLQANMMQEFPPNECSTQPFDMAPLLPCNEYSLQPSDLAPVPSEMCPLQPSDATPVLPSNEYSHQPSNVAPILPTNDYSMQPSDAAPVLPSNECPYPLQSFNVPVPNQNPSKPPPLPPMANQRVAENGSFRLRMRKQVNPERAPFF
ncbi:hypothetical protein ACP4OV_011346 [Aristida adscensionis]